MRTREKLGEKRRAGVPSDTGGFGICSPGCSLGVACCGADTAQPCYETLGNPRAVPDPTESPELALHQELLRPSPTAAFPRERRPPLPAPAALCSRLQNLVGKKKEV